MKTDAEKAVIHARWRALQDEAAPSEIVLDEMDVVGGDVTYRTFFARHDSVEAIADSIERHFKCVKGRPSRIAETGEEYVEFSEVALCRNAPFDMDVAKRHVLSRMASKLCCYLMHPEDEEHTVYWRIPLEEDSIDAPQVVHYAEDGPDVEFFTGKHCVLDRDWKRYGVYCRLLRSNKPVKGVV